MGGEEIERYKGLMACAVPRRARPEIDEMSQGGGDGATDPKGWVHGFESGGRGSRESPPSHNHK